MFDLKAVRAAGNKPRVHGNGFIQLDLDERQRLHIWGDPRIPKQSVGTTIHDHVFAFDSIILVGRLLNVVYSVNKVAHSGDYTVYTPTLRQGEDTMLEPTDIDVIARPLRVELVQVHTRYDSYHMPAFEFHETFTTEPSATVITKTGRTQAQGSKIFPRVLVPIYEEPDNKFTRYDVHEDNLWRIIEDTLDRRSL